MNNGCYHRIIILWSFYFLQVMQKVDIPNWVVLIVQSLTFGAGLAGISYGILSTSWDQRREGSFWGTDEFKANLPIVMERFKPKN